MPKFKKYKFWLAFVNFLGHLVMVKGIEVDLTKVETVTKWPRPSSVSKICSLLRLAGYYRRFIECFSIIAGSITYLIKKWMKLQWIERCEQSFSRSETMFNHITILAIPECLDGFIIYNDKSKQGLGCALIRNGTLIAYASRQLKKCK